jgi:hypothetical protein
MLDFQMYNNEPRGSFSIINGRHSNTPPTGCVFQPESTSTDDIHRHNINIRGATWRNFARTAKPAGSLALKFGGRNTLWSI